MLDWKILAASIVALLFISSVFVGSFGIRDFLSDILDSVGGYLGDSPFTGLLTSDDNEKPKTGQSKEITILLTPDTLTLTPDNEVTLTSEETVYTGFSGGISLDFNNNSVELQTGSLKVTSPLRDLKISDLTLQEFSVDDTRLEIKPDISTDSGNLELEGFSGTAVATKRGLELTGTVTSLLVHVGSHSFELV